MPIQQFNMVGVVQLAEHRIVVPDVVGSSPITHPTQKQAGAAGFILYLTDGGM